MSAASLGSAQLWEQREGPETASQAGLPATEKLSSLKTYSELEAASEQTTAHAVGRKSSLLHPSLLFPGAFSLQRKATEADTVHPPSRYGPGQQKSPVGTIRLAIESNKSLW